MKPVFSYLIVGAGGTGGAIGAYLAKAGKPVTWIARGSHLSAIRERGLTLSRPDDSFTIHPATACTMEEYEGRPDVIFVCVKGYSVSSILPFLKRVSDSHTIVIPVLNIYGTGGKMQPHLPGVSVMDGCIYVAAHRESDGIIRMNSYLLRVVFGPRNRGEFRHTLNQIRDDLAESGMEAVLSDDIRRDALVKYSYISAQNACGMYYNVPAGPMQHPGRERDCFAALSREVEALGHAMGISFDMDLAKHNLDIIDSLGPDMMTSMQRDLLAGRPSEIDGLIFEVTRLAKQYGILLPEFEKITNALSEKYR